MADYESIFEWKASGEQQVGRMIKSLAGGIKSVREALRATAKETPLAEAVIGDVKIVRATTESIRDEFVTVRQGLETLSEPLVAFEERQASINRKIELETALIQKLQKQMMTTRDPVFLDKLIEDASAANDRLSDLQYQMEDLEAAAGRSAGSEFDMYGGYGGYGSGAMSRASQGSMAVTGGLSGVGGMLRELETVDKGFADAANTVDMFSMQIGNLVSVMDTFQQFKDLYQMYSAATKTATAATTAGAGAQAVLATTSTAGAGGVLALAGSIATMLAPLAPLIAAGAALAVVFKRMQDEARKAEERTLQTLDSQQEFYSFVATATTEEVDRRLQDMEAERVARQAFNQQLQDDLEIVRDFNLDSSTGIGPALTQYFEEADEVSRQGFQDYVEGLGYHFNSELGQSLLDNFDAVANVMQEFGGQIDDSKITERLNEIATETNLAAVEEQRLITARDSGIVATNDARVEAERMADNLADAEAELMSARLGMVDVTERLQESIADFEEEYAFQRSRELEDRQREDADALADHLDSLATMEADTKERIEDIRDEMSQSLVDAIEEFREANTEAYDQLQEDLASLTDETREALGERQEAYYEETLKAQEEYQRERVKAEERYAKERRRRIEDLNESLLDAEMQNDVLAFLEAEKQAEKDLRRMEEDHQDQQGEAEENFFLMREERLASYRQEIADIQENANERRQELMDSYQDERATRATEHKERLALIRSEAKERIRAEELSLKEQREAAVESYEQQREEIEEQRELMDARTAEDNERRLQDMRDQADAEIAELREREQRALEVIQTQGDISLTEIENRENQIRVARVNSARQTQREIMRMARRAATELRQIQASGRASRASRRGGGGAGDAAITGGILAARGALLTRPTLMIAGEGEKPEVVLPFNESGGIPDETLRSLLPQERLTTAITQAMLPAQGGGIGASAPTVNFNAPISISGGEGVTPDFVQTKLEELGMTLVRSVYNARAGSVRR